MISSAEIAILQDIAELAKRAGLRPSEANTILIMDEDKDRPHVLRFYEYPSDSDKAEKYDKFLERLGIEESQRVVAQLGLEYPEIRAGKLSDLEDLVERALSLTARGRGR